MCMQRYHHHHHHPTIIFTHTHTHMALQLLAVLPPRPVDALRLLRQRRGRQLSCYVMPRPIHSCKKK